MHCADSQIITLDQLPEVAQKFAATIQQGQSVCLSGEMGAGKTTFLFHVVQSLGLIDGMFSSPTFSIHQTYQTQQFPVHHFDLYRLQSYAELDALDLLDDLFCKTAVSFVEWGDKFAELLPRYTHRLHLDYVPEQPEQRVLTIQPRSH